MLFRSIRGGIVDVFPAGDAEPVRVEFVGDQVESMRRFDPVTQRSTGSVDRLVVVPVRERFEDDTDLLSAVDAFGTASGLDLLIVEADLVDQQLNGTRDQLDAAYADASARGPVTVGAPLELFADAAAISQRLASGRRFEELALGDDGVPHVACQPSMEFRGRVGDWIADIRQARQRGDTVLFVAESSGRAERVVEIFRDYDIVAVPLDRAEDEIGRAHV